MKQIRARPEIQADTEASIGFERMDLDFRRCLTRSFWTCDLGGISCSSDPLIAEALRNRNRGRCRSRGTAYMLEKNILYFVIDLDCDSDTEPDLGTRSHDDNPFHGEGHSHIF
jgi:hypothetical protein